MSGKIRLASKDRRELADWATERGWQWTITGSGHIRFDHSTGAGPVFAPCSPRVGGGHKERAKLATALRRHQSATVSSNSL